MLKRFYGLLICAAVFSASCHSFKALQTAQPEPAAAEREFRAAWVATVANINWPSKPGLSTQQQQQEAIALLDFLEAHHFNAVIFQVRPQADALYESRLEPWSYYLTGQEGKAPEPYYDPLQFWIDAAHNRGLELHVWLNPYRAHHTTGGPVSSASIIKQKPELVVPLKEGYWWFDPAKKGTQDHGVAVVMDLVKRYDIDGVHFDDYFYPYPSYNGNEDFPDDESWTAYQAGGGKLSRSDWRRQSVNLFIERLYKSIKAEKKHVKFGLSPFGIWRPGHPASITGLDQYEGLYADAKLWLNKGWVDYFSPQLYWPISRQAQSFPVLLGWWQQQNLAQRHLWPGISVSRDTSAKSVTETINQIMITRGMLPQDAGVVHWSIGSVIKNPSLSKLLVQGPYKKQALVPASPWLNSKAPAPPLVQVVEQNDSLNVSWKPGSGTDAFKWVVYYKYGSLPDYTVLNHNSSSLQLPLFSADGKNRLTYIAVCAVDRTGVESTRAVAQWPKLNKSEL